MWRGQSQGGDSTNTNAFLQKTKTFTLVNCFYQVLLAGNVMRPVPGDPTKTQFTTIAHVNPGGAADTPLGAQVTFFSPKNLPW